MAICLHHQYTSTSVHHQVKFTIPGPMTIADGVKNKHYEDVENLHRHLPTFQFLLFFYNSMVESGDVIMPMSDDCCLP